MKELEGQKIIRLSTIGSWYADNKIILTDDRAHQYKMDIGELKKILNELTFKVIKKKTWKHLEIIAINGEYL